MLGGESNTRGPQGMRLTRRARAHSARAALLAARSPRHLRLAPVFPMPPARPLAQGPRGGGRRPRARARARPRASLGRSARARATARLHDVGEQAIPHSSLNKPASLSASEWAVMRRHPEWVATCSRRCRASTRRPSVPLPPRAVGRRRLRARPQRRGPPRSRAAPHRRGVRRLQRHDHRASLPRRALRRRSARRAPPLRRLAVRPEDRGRLRRAHGRGGPGLKAAQQTVRSPRGRLAARVPARPVDRRGRSTARRTR